MSGDLTRSTVRGVTWFGISQAMNQGLRFIAMIVLARLLLPEDFGVIAMTIIITELVLQTGDMGFSEAIIQRKEVTASHLSTSFWTGLALGVIFCIVTVAISPFVANFFGEDQVGPILAVSALAFVIAPLRMVHGALLRKRLQFFKFSIAEIGQGVAYVAVAIPLAFAGLGVWSLVLGNLASHIVLVILRWVVCRWHPSIMFSFRSLRDLWGFGSNLTGSAIVGFLAYRLDYLIVGRFLATATLGFYNMASRITSFTSAGLRGTVFRVAFPTFSIVQDEDERLRRGFIKSVTYLSLIIFPMFAGLAIVAPELVKVVFGQKWTPSILPMQILCISAFASVGVTIVPLFRSKGRPDIELKLCLAKLALTVSCLLIAVKFGVLGIAAGGSAVAVINWLIFQTFANRLIGLRMRDCLAALRPAALGAVVMALTLLAFRYAAANLLNLPDVGILISSVLLGIAVYLITLKAARVETIGEMIGLILEMVKPYARLVMAKMPWVWRYAPHVVGIVHEDTE